MSSIRVLHLGTEKSWRGGENQIRLLAVGGRKLGLDSHIGYPKKSAAIERMRLDFPVLELASSSPIDPRSVLAIRKYCLSNSISILNAHSSAAMSLALAVKSLLPHLKLVVHRRVAFPIKSGVFSQKKYLSSKVDQYVCISSYIKSVLVDAGVPDQKIKVVPSAIDSQLYDEIVREKSDSFCLGMTSALTSEKGHDTVLSALAKLEVDFELLIAGSGSEESRLKELVRDLGLSKKVSFVGQLPDIKSFMKSLDVFLMPSRFEGLGTSVLEAMAANVFVVGSRTGGIPEMVQHNETGLLAKVDDVVDWSEKIKLAIQDSKLRSRCVSAARKHIETDFSLSAMVEGNLKVYKALKPHVE